MGLDCSVSRCVLHGAECPIRSTSARPSLSALSTQLCTMSVLYKAYVCVTGPARSCGYAWPPWKQPPSRTSPTLAHQNSALQYHPPLLSNLVYLHLHPSASQSMHFSLQQMQVQSVARHGEAVVRGQGHPDVQAQSANNVT